MMKQQNLQSRRKGGYRVLQRGQGMTEYIIIVALIAIAGIAAFTLFGNVIRSQLAGIAAELSGGDGQSQITESKTHAGNLDTDAQKKKNMGNYNGENNGGGG